MLDMYYEQRGWDNNGLPTQATLEILNLTALVV
jgi:aldehyde:ferredoxin oxidoreductase